MAEVWPIPTPKKEPAERQGARRFKVLSRMRAGISKEGLFAAGRSRVILGRALQIGIEARRIGADDALDLGGDVGI